MLGGMPETPIAERPTIGTVAAHRDATVDPRTGEPRRPVWVWLSAALFGAGIAVVTFGTLWAFWFSVRTFTEAAWLNRIVPTEPGDLLRVALVTGLFAITLIVGAAALIAGYYAWKGHRWTRWAGLVAAALSPLALMVNPIAAWCIAPIAVAAALLWLPPVRAWFDRWYLRRHPAPATPVVASDVHYGPLPRYR